MHFHGYDRAKLSSGSSYADQARNSAYWAENAVMYTGGTQPHNNI